jgi:hypothetical protein
MQKRIGLIVAFTLFLLVVQAQQKLNYPEVDKVSYELYLQGKWTELIDYAKEARRQDIDFFYLQARTGIAYYNLKKYRTASEWFLKAWENDQSFEWLQEYVYYSLVFGGRRLEASKFADNFTVAFKQKIYYQSMMPIRVALEVGYSYNPDANSLKETPFDNKLNLTDEYGEAFIMRNYQFESFDYSHQIAPGVIIDHNLTHVGVRQDEQVFWGNRHIFPVNMNQFQYFASPSMVINKKWYVSPALNFTWGSSTLVLGDYSPNSFYYDKFKYSDFIFSTATWSHFGNVSPGAEINLASVNDNKFTQLSAWLTVYPFSNLNFYFTPRVYFKSNEENGFGFNTFGISGGAQLGPVHFYGQYLNGEMENFIESGGYVVANFPGVSEQKFSGSIYFPTGKSYQLVLRYLSQDITETYKVYANLTESNSVNYNYVKHTLTAGISWNF